MIRNDREYRITKAQAADFEKALAALEKDTGTDVHPKIRKAQSEAVRSQFADLRVEISDYEALRDGRRGAIELTSLDELPQALIQGRIAAGLTQSDLAKRLGVLEQQVQRYEATEYASASFSRMVEVANAVGITVREDVFLPVTEVSEGALLRRLGEAGLDRDFVQRVLLSVENGEASKAAPVLRATTAAQRIFGWTPVEILTGTETLQLYRGAQNAAMFKVYSNADERRTLVLAAFGEYIAKLILRASSFLPVRTIPLRASDFRELMLAHSGQIDLATAVATLWELGVPVVPLAQSGGYHGACWRFAGRNVIVLKQRTTSEARWLHDLLHEARHAATEPDKPEFAWFDYEVMPIERRLAPEEKRATKFAGDVQLNGHAEDLARECVAAAGKSAERLKGVVPKIAKAHGVSIAALANYLAWRLAMDGINWWGAAANLQGSGGEPGRVVRDFLVPRLDWSKLDHLDRDLLTKALQDVA